MGHFAGIGNKQFYVDESNRYWDVATRTQEYNRQTLEPIIVADDCDIKVPEKLRGGVVLPDPSNAAEISFDAKLDNFVTQSLNGNKESRQGISRASIARFMGLNTKKTKQRNEAESILKSVLQKYEGQLMRYKLGWYFKDDVKTEGG